MNWLWIYLIGGFHNFIGEKIILLAKKIFYWRKFSFIGDFHNFISETESAPRFVNQLAATKQAIRRRASHSAQ